MSETPATASQTHATGAAAPRKRYDYVRVRLCMPDNAITTISLDRDLVERAARVLGSEKKARALAQSAALQYVEGQSPARTRSNFAARALQRLLLTRPVTPT
ncbi:MAG: hypothetical protein ACYCV6_01665 [Steroidobacteraceae bacterium]